MEKAIHPSWATGIEQGLKAWKHFSVITNGWYTDEKGCHIPWKYVKDSEGSIFIEHENVMYLLKYISLLSEGRVVRSTDKVITECKNPLCINPRHLLIERKG